MTSSSQETVAPPRAATWADVDLACITANTQYVVRIAAVPVMAVLKADGYGHGAMPVAMAALRGGATWCGVARSEEALDLRRRGLDCPILLLGWAPNDLLHELVASSVSLTVWSAAQVDEIAAAARTLGRTAKLHLKVDTGMTRLGVEPQEAVKMARRIREAEGVELEAVFTHFACADDPASGVTASQEASFRQVVASLSDAGLRPGLIHAANSAATLQHPTTRFDLVRLGIALFGIEPSPTCPLPPELKPALTWKAVLTQVKVVPPGRGVSYGHHYTTTRQERIGAVAVGYGDGYRRTDGNVVLIGGRRVPVVGRVCMDQLLVQLDGVPEAKMGDEAVLIGTQGQERLRTEDIAAIWGTLSYEVVCGITDRVPRRYV
jgi:alanine racemase